MVARERQLERAADRRVTGERDSHDHDRGRSAELRSRPSRAPDSPPLAPCWLQLLSVVVVDGHFRHGHAETDCATQIDREVERLPIANSEYSDEAATCQRRT